MDPRIEIFIHYIIVIHYYYSAHSPLGLFSDRLHQVLRLLTVWLFQVDIDRREQCCAANYEQVVNHVVPSCYS
jgi:hypothetical protein